MLLLLLLFVFSQLGLMLQLLVCQALEGKDALAPYEFETEAGWLAGKDHRATVCLKEDACDLVGKSKKEKTENAIIITFVYLECGWQALSRQDREDVQAAWSRVKVGGGNGMVWLKTVRRKLKRQDSISISSCHQIAKGFARQSAYICEAKGNR